MRGNRLGHRVRGVAVEFHEKDGTFTGTGQGGRLWRITQSRTGWRLEFRDTGDLKPTNAGNHGTLEAAKNEAGK